ncbi:calretinin-like [Coregonus clupeaformis]|uniref:calretinin-like n=1 Tax=Coregonus clupeaformis TaxID=59861 RepID=UPI001E1C6787|nr:calretinin-like [Coregonus clupeaformis]
MGHQNNHTKVGTEHNKECLINISKYKFSLVISGLTNVLKNVNNMQIFGEAAEKNLYLSQLIILDTLEKCLVSRTWPPARCRAPCLCLRGPLLPQLQQLQRCLQPHLHQDPSNSTFKEKMKEFMQKFDKNADGRIEMSELAQILPTEENFLLCFREFVGSSSEFMAAWRRYDTDRSGYIEANELKGFLSDLLKKANRHYDDQKLHEYTQTILKMFDLNGDGKLGLSEMARLLPVQENFLLKFQGIKLTSEQFNTIFTFYDKDFCSFYCAWFLLRYPTSR